MGAIHERTAMVDDLQRETCVAERIVHTNGMNTTTDRPAQAPLERWHRG